MKRDRRPQEENKEYEEIRGGQRCYVTSKCTRGYRGQGQKEGGRWQRHPSTTQYHFSFKDKESRPHHKKSGQVLLVFVCTLVFEIQFTFHLKNS